MRGAQDRDTAGRVLPLLERDARATALWNSPHTLELYGYGVSDDGTRTP